MSRRCKFWLLFLVWLAAVFRFQALFANRFHADEALFASLARLIATWRDPLLQTQLVDKPPLLFYLQALFYPLLGAVEWAARLPNFVASLWLVPLVGVWAWRLYRHEVTAVVAAAFVALSPLAIQFSATAFTDPLLTTLLVASLVAASGGTRTADGPIPHAVKAGLLFGLAVLTKYQAWLFLPLLLAAGILTQWRWRHWRGWLLGLVPLLSLLLVWDVAHTGQLSLWSSQMVNFGGIRLIWSWELWPRLRAWLELWRFLVGPPGLALLLGLLVLLMVVWLRPFPRRIQLWHRLLLLFLFAYFWLHWLLAVPVWDRYLLPLVPVAALLIGRGLAGLWGLMAERVVVERRQAVVVTILLLVLVGWQLPAVAMARNGRFSVGGQPTADQGAAQVARLLYDAPYGTVLYDHWFSWHWRYHLFDKTVYVSWFPHPAALAQDLKAFGHNDQKRYLALPSSPVAAPVQRAIVAAGFQLRHVAVPGQTGIVLYEIVPPTSIRQVTITP